jgi:hypothetical protein
MIAMKRITAVFSFFLLLTFGASATPLGFSARTAIPAQVQQIISVDYRALRNSESGMALKSRVLPENLKQFEQALRRMAIDPDQDIEQLAFVSFRDNGMTRSIGLAQGVYDTRKFQARFKAKGSKAEKYHQNDLYNTGTGMVVSFLDSTTMLFGDPTAVKKSLNVRDGDAESLGSNAEVNDLISSVEGDAVWSVLDKAGTQHMMASALGEASSLSDYSSVRKRMLGSRYAVNFNHGISFSLDVVTTDTVAAGTLASLFKAGMVYKRSTGTAVEKEALNDISVDNSSSDLQLRFKAEDKKFQSLLHSDLFAAVAR